MTEPHDLYLHCTVELCVPEDHLSCSPVSAPDSPRTFNPRLKGWGNGYEMPQRFIVSSSSSQNCNSISKREAVRAEPSVGLLSYGPIKIEMSKRPEFSKLLLSPRLLSLYDWEVIDLLERMIGRLLTCLLCDWEVIYVFGGSLVTAIMPLASCFRHPGDGGAARSGCLDYGLLPHHPHHGVQGGQQEAHTARAALSTMVVA